LKAVDTDLFFPINRYHQKRGSGLVELIESTFYNGSCYILQLSFENASLNFKAFLKDVVSIKNRTDLLL
jgi:hypothetical protein